MRIATRVWLGATFACSWFYCREARATTELPAQYDARSVGLGGTGASFIENGASIFLNPAALDGIKTVAATVVLSPVQPVLTVPLAPPPMNTPVKADTPFFPLFLAGAGFRLSDRVVAGVAVYPTAGVGSVYTKAIGGQDLSMSIAQFEAAPALSVKIIDGLSLGLSYRITYTRQTVRQPGAAGPADITLDGFNYFGVQAGLYFRPAEIVHLAFTYRSRVDTELSGTTETGGMKFDTKSGFNSPNRFRLGASISPPGVPLLVAADIKYLLYADANQTSDVTITTPMGAQTTTQRLDWKNTLGFGLGVECMVAPIVAARVGYSLSQSATPESTANPFTPPPGAIHGVHLGVGLKLPVLDLDAGGVYAFANRTIDPSPSNMMVLPGEYKLTTLIFALSATYHM